VKTLEKAVRPATEDDLEAINDIYNHYVRTSHATFDIHEKTKEWRRVWFEDRQSDPHRVFVAQRDGHLLGFASSGAHRSKPAYRTSVETSVYVAPDSVGRGIGKALYGALFAAFRGQDVHRAVAGIALPNDASVALHTGFGFRLVGRFTEQGRKFGRYWDVAWYERPVG
jgi:phosphinothricin acetyltransferase